MSEHKELDGLHIELIKLLDLICTTDNPDHSTLRFDIIEKHGYKINVLDTAVITK